MIKAFQVSVIVCMLRQTSVYIHKSIKWIDQRKETKNEHEKSRKIGYAWAVHAGHHRSRTVSDSSPTTTVPVDDTLRFLACQTRTMHHLNQSTKPTADRLNHISGRAGVSSSSWRGLYGGVWRLWLPSARPRPSCLRPASWQPVRRRRRRQQARSSPPSRPPSRPRKCSTGWLALPCLLL